MLTPFKAYFKSTLVIASVLSVVALSSCRDDETKPTDSAAPSVTVTTTATSTTVWNTVGLKIEATDNTGIKSIELKIDNVSVGTATTSPYEFQWDTQAAADGEHTIVGIAKDEAGNEKSMEIKLTVQNILLEASIPEDFLSVDRESQYQQRGFIFLSDNEGKVIVAEEFENGDEIKLKAPAFNGNEFTVTQAQTRYSDSEFNLTTTAKVSRGKWVMEYHGYYGENQNPAGEAELAIANVDDAYQYMLVTNGGSRSIGFEDFTISATLQVNPSKLFIYRRNYETGEETYDIIPSIVIGNTNTEVDLSLAVKEFTHEVKNVPNDFPYVDVSYNGLRTSGTNTEIYNGLGSYSSQEGGTINTRYPADAFPDYFSGTYFQGEGPWVGYNRSKKPYDLVPLAATVEASVSGNTLTVTTTGNFDCYTIYTEVLYQTWKFYGNKNTTEIIIPELPQILKDVSRDLTEAWINPMVYDYKDFDGYDGLLTYVKESDLGYYELESNELIEYKSISREDFGDGRKRSSKKGMATRAMARMKKAGLK
jgi:hypothetical protein